MKGTMDTTIQNLPSGPPSLCFEKDDFMKKSFNVEQFVVECRRRVPMETLRDDLSVYLKILQTAMIELINKDYADFVNLSTNLVGVDKALSSIVAPLGQLREEVQGVSVALDEAIEEVEVKMKQQQELRERKLTLQRLMSIMRAVEKIERMLNLHSSDDTDMGPRELKGQLLERVGTEFNKLQFFVNKCRGMSLVEQVRPRIANITVTLQHSLEGTLKEGIEQNDNAILCQCLRTYAVIDKVKDAHNLYRQNFVRPYMEDVINDDFIKDHPDGLQGMYNAILDFVPKHCSKLLQITRVGNASGESVQGYDFLINAVWPEIVSNIEARTPSIFAPGNPNMFQEKYLLSMKFVDKFEHLCGSQASVKRLRSHPSYSTFMSKWSLPVYFQIRFQEIAGALETALITPFNCSESEKFHLHATEKLWWCLHQCWKPGVFLEPLCHRFFKFSLQLLSRYSSWINEVASSQLPDKTELQLPTSISTSSSMSKLGNGEPDIQRSSSPMPHAEPPLTMGQIVKLVADVENLKEMYLNEFYASTIEPALTKMGIKDCSFVKESLEESIISFTKPLESIDEFIIAELSVHATAPIRLVNDIPRLYRRTNRDIPSKCSPYVGNVLKPLQMFLDEHKDILSDQNKNMWLEKVLSTAADNYLSATSDVLTSVKKMEESLKRLKKNKSSSANLNALGMSDDDKIRLQLFIDVKYFGEQILAMGITKDIEAYKKLSNLVETAKGSN